MVDLNDVLRIDGQSKLSDFPERFNHLVRVVERLIKAIIFLLTVVTVLVIQSFLSGQIGQLFGLFSINWAGIPEQYQLVILAAVLTIPAGVLVHYVNRKYVDPIFIESSRQSSSSPGKQGSL